MTLDSCWQFDIGDIRLNRLAVELINAMTEKLSVVFRQIAGSRKKEVSFNRLMNNKKFTASTIISSETVKTSKLANRCDHVLVIQDTTELGFESSVQGYRPDLGFVGRDLKKGFKIHPSLVVDAKSGNCLGLSSFFYWKKITKKHENGTNRHRNKLPIEDKESYRWIKNASDSKKNIGTETLKTIIADRESDIYELFYQIPDADTHLLVRSSYNRNLTNGKKLQEFIDEQDIAGTFQIELQEITGKRKARDATMVLKYTQVEICKTEICKDTNAPKCVTLTLIEVLETTDSVEAKKRTHWKLITTHSVSKFEEARQIVAWYQQRWNIEQLFRMLKKQGLKVESSQVTTYDGLVKVAILATITAVRCMQLTLARTGNQTKDVPINYVFTHSDQVCLEGICDDLQGKTASQMNVNPQGTLRWAAWIIARLGGWKGYKSERAPGPITMKNGLDRFFALKQGWQLGKSNFST